MERAEALPGEPGIQRRPLTPGAALFSFLLAGLWGGNTVALKAGLDDAPPLRLGWMRFLLGGIVVLVWALVGRQSLRIRRHKAIWKPAKQIMPMAPNSPRTCR